MYTPQNISNFNAAFSGCLAGLGFTGRTFPTSEDPAVYASVINTAGAYAQAVDTAFGTTSFPILTTFLESLSEGIWSDRGIPSSSTDFAGIAQTVVGISEAVLDYYISQSIPLTNAGSSIVKQMRNDQVAAPGFGTITQGDAAKVVNTVNITTGDGTLRIICNLSGNGAVHDGAITLSIYVDTVLIQGRLVSWVAADDVSRTITIAVDADVTAGAHVVESKIVISAGAAGTTFTDAEQDNLLVTEYQNQS